MDALKRSLGQSGGGRRKAAPAARKAPASKAPAKRRAPAKKRA
jgi:hypothetical protein